MDVLLAGMNVDKTLLDEIIENLRKSAKTLSDETITSDERYRSAQKIFSFLEAESITPETISAAYARISRDPRPVNQLREDARLQVGKARRSNRTIIFGLGHSSVAEHAVFNLDVIGISRWLSESIQSHRLCSFTEKSQRYIRLSKDYIIPDELQNHSLAGEFEQFVKSRFDDYRLLTEIIAGLPDHDPSLAAEDARYILPLSVTTQMGMTVNARNIEMILQEAASSDLAEYREFGKRLYSIIDGIAPSVVKYTQPSSLEKDTSSAIRSICSGNIPDQNPATNGIHPVQLLRFTPDADRLIASAIVSREAGFRDMFNLMDLSDQQVHSIFLEIFRRMNPWDTVPREFEYVDFLFELVISAAAFAQLKRHRMMTITTGPYDSELGIRTPPVLAGTRGEDILRKAERDSKQLYAKIATFAPAAAPYCRLACHQRRVLIKVNVRELIHLSRLREDQHAQWDIRHLAAEMISQARQKAPGSLIPACGKHSFEMYKRELHLI